MKMKVAILSQVKLKKLDWTYWIFLLKVFIFILFEQYDNEVIFKRNKKFQQANNLKSHIYGKGNKTTIFQNSKNFKTSFLGLQAWFPRNETLIQ